MPIIYQVILLLAFLGSTVAQEVVDGTCLLQVDFALQRRQPETVANSDKWFAWDARLPQFKEANESEGTAGGLVRVWSHLGNKWWMEFIDGQFHKDGPHALDHSAMNSKDGMDGEFYQHSKELYMRFSAQSQWDDLLTADLIAQMNAVHQGISCVNTSCSEAYHYSCSDHDNCRMLLQRLLTDYYNSTMLLQGLERSTRLRKGLPHIAKLFGGLASLHAFRDANSRTRMLVLQIELVRLGGHPVVLWGFREDVYNHCDFLNCELEGLRDLLLNGWCAWETIATTGASPFQSGQYKECYDPSTESCLDSPLPKPEPTGQSWMKEGQTGIVDRA